MKTNSEMTILYTLCIESGNYGMTLFEMIRCANCGRLNDYDSLMQIAKRKGEEWAEKQASELIEKEIKKMKKFFRGLGQ